MHQGKPHAPARRGPWEGRLTVIGSATRNIKVGGSDIELTVKQYREIQTLLRRKKKIDAVLALKRYAGVEMRVARDVVEHPENFSHDEESVPVESGGFLETINALRHGQIGFEKWIKANQRVIAASVGVVWLLTMAVVGYSTMPRSARATTGPTVWYYDLNTGFLFKAPERTPPIDAPSGLTDDGKPAGVRAYVFTCGRCGTKDEFIGWVENIGPPQIILQKPVTEPAKDGAKAATKDADQLVVPKMTMTPGDAATGEKPKVRLAAPLLITQSSGRLVRRPDDTRWVLADSAEGQAIQAEALGKCGKGDIMPCDP